MSRKHTRNKHHQNHVLRLESLEVRQMLSVSPLSSLPMEDVPAVMNSVEVVEIAEVTEPAALQAEAVGTSSAPAVGGIAQLDDDTIFISWTEIENAESYSVFDESGAVLAENVTETFCELDGLNLALTQTLSVRANFADGADSDAGQLTVSLNELDAVHRTRPVPDCSSERMAKDFAYKNWRVGDKVRSSFLGMTLQEYKVVATFDYWTLEGMYAVAFQNTQSKEVVLALRGTDNIASILIDADPTGIGYTVATKHLNEIVSWAKKYVQTPGRELHLTGHSLGGALAQWITVGLTKNDIYVKEVNTFNSPGISQDYIDQNYEAANCGKMVHYIQSGDIVSMAGQAFVPGTCRMYYYLDWKIISKHSVPMTVPEIEGYERPWIYSCTEISTDSLSAPKFTYSQNTANPGQNEYIDKVYRAQVYMLGKCLSVFKNLSARDTTESTRREIGKFIQKYLPIFNGTEGANAADMGEIAASDTRALVDVNTKKNGKYEVYCFALTDPDDPAQALEVGSQEVDGKKTVEFDQLTPETEYVLASVRYEYDAAGEIIGVLDAQYALFQTEAEPKVVSQNGTKIIFNPGIQDDCKCQIKRSNGKTWYTLPTSENADGNTIASVSRSRLGDRAYDYRFVNSEGEVLAEGTFTFATLDAPSFSVEKIAQKPNDFLLKVKSLDTDAADHKISFRYLSDGRWSDWTDEMSFAEWKLTENVTANEDGTYTVTGLPAGCHVQVRLRSEGGYDGETETLQVDSRTVTRGCTLVRGEKLSAPVISVRADSVNSVVVKVKKLDTDAHDLTYRYRTFSGGKWSAWSDSIDAEIRNGQFRITDLPLNSHIEIHARATSDNIALRDSAAVVRFSQVKHVSRLTTPKMTFNVSQNRVTLLVSQPAADGFLLEGKIPGAKWISSEDLLSVEDLESLKLADFVSSFITSEQAAAFRIGSTKALRLRLTAKSSDLDFADSLSRILTIRFTWTQALSDLFAPQ